MREGTLAGAARMRRYAIVKEHLLRTKGGGAAEPLSIRYSTPAGGFGRKIYFFWRARRGSEVGGRRSEVGGEGVSGGDGGGRCGTRRGFARAWVRRPIAGYAVSRYLPLCLHCSVADLAAIFLFGSARHAVSLRGDVPPASASRPGGYDRGNAFGGYVWSRAGEYARHSASRVGQECPTYRRNGQM